MSAPAPVSLCPACVLAGSSPADAPEATRGLGGIETPCPSECLHTLEGGTWMGK